MIEIKLNFVNNSVDVNNSEVVIFQKNEAASADELAVAWTVIENCGPGWSHAFTFPVQTYVAVGDSWGNLSPALPAADGERFSVEISPSGDILKPAGKASGPKEIEVVNALKLGAISANITRDGKLLAAKTGVEPGQKAVFAFSPIIWIGVVSQMQEGEVMNSAIMSQLNTQISLMGIASADIVMTGGGPGPVSSSFVFTLENVEYA